MTRVTTSNTWLDRLGCAGNAAVEFALIIPVLLLLIIGIFEFGRAYWIQNTLQYSAEQTARCVLGKSTGTVIDTSSSASASTGCPYTANTPLNGVNWDSTNNSSTFTCFTGSKSKCQMVRLTYSFTFSPLLAAMMGLVVHGSASLPPITFVGQSQVPIG